MKPSTYENRVDELQADDNKARYDERQAHRKELVSNLSDLLKQDIDRDAIVSRLTELGFKTSEGEQPFQERTLDELKDDLIRDGITQLEEESNGVLRVADTVPENANKPQAPNILQLRPKIKTLEEVGGERWIDYDKMLEAYGKLKAEPIRGELTRVKKQFAEILLGGNFDVFVSASRNIHRQTEEWKSPIIMPPRPQQLIIDNNQQVGDSIATMQEIMKKAANADNSLKPLCFSYCIPEDVKNKVWDSSLTVWTSACLKGSKDKNYQAQLQHQAEILGAEYGIEADMILAMALRYISEKEELMCQDDMRLNILDTDGDPLGVSFNVILLSFGYARSSARPSSGVGASFRISS